MNAIDEMIEKCGNYRNRTGPTYIEVLISQYKDYAKQIREANIQIDFEIDFSCR